MTAKNATVSVPKGVWTRLTDSAGASAETTCVLLDDVEIWLNATTSATVPPAEVSAEDGDRLPVLLSTGNGWNNITLGVLFPGVVGTHLWAFSPYGPARVFISHA